MRASSSHRKEPTIEDTEDADKNGSEKNFIVGLERGLKVIRAFANQRDRLSISEVSKSVNLSRAAVRRCLITLHELGYVEMSGKYFRLSSQILTLSQAYFSSSSLPHIAQPHIEQASKLVGESCSVSVLSGDEVIFVARSSRRRETAFYRDVGVNLPAYCTSIGRVLLANLPEAAIELYLKRANFTKYTPKTTVDKAAFKAILREAREQEFCTIDGELELNLRAVAVPVRNMSGTVVAAAHISTDAGRVSIKQMHSEFLPVLRQAVAEIRRSLVG